MLLLGTRSPYLLVTLLYLMTGVTLPLSGQGSDSTSLFGGINPDELQPRELWRAGVYAGLNYNLHSTPGIAGLPDVPSCCPSYEEGQGNGAALGLLAELPLADALSVGSKLTLNSYSGTLRALQHEEVNADRTLVIATFEHTIATSLLGTGLEPYLAYELIPNLKVSAGFRADFMLGATFRQREVLLDPEGITFENGKRVRMEYEGDIQNANPFYTAITANLRYDFSISEEGDWIIAPELSVWYGLTDMMSDVPWRVHGGRLGISLQHVRIYYPELPTEVIEPILPIRSGPKESSGTESKESE